MLTNPQLQAIKTLIAGTPAMSSQPNSGDGNSVVAALLNAAAAPDYWVWRTKVTRAEYTNTVSVDGTTFSWVGAGFITRSVGERDAWSALFADGPANPSLANVRQAFSDIFSGATAPAPANRTHLTAVSRRRATVGEKALATGTGSTASPAVMGFEGELTYQDVEQARNLP